MVYRPGGFPEYTPAEQKIFDLFMDILRKHFSQSGYHHIATPSVEPVDILKRGGDVVDKQVYGLYGLAQGPEDTKDYALHFDLTIPFARYTLDHLNDMVFPFKRYQIQPVWRGERQKRGRYKEFRQFDIDTIWREGTDVGVRYDAESIAVMMRALTEVFRTLQLDSSLVVKISHIRLIQSLLSSRGVSEQLNKTVFKILDDRYKRPLEVNHSMLSDCLTSDQVEFLVQVIDTKDLKLLASYEGYDDLSTIGGYLTQLGIQREFALPIVRGHAYYTGMVAEIFVEDDIELGAIAGGGRYEKLTDFIDRKHSFSGVGMSVSNRIMDLLLNSPIENIQRDGYFFLYFGDTSKDIIALYQKFLSEGKQCELYPTDAKFGKQIELADKKWYRYVIILGSDELAKGEYQVKDLQTGEIKKEKLV